MLEGILLIVGTFSGPLLLLLGFGVVAFVNRIPEESDSSDSSVEDSSDTGSGGSDTFRAAFFTQAFQGNPP